MWVLCAESAEGAGGSRVAEEAAEAREPVSSPAGGEAQQTRVAGS